MRLSTVPRINVGNKQPVFAPRVEGVQGETKNNAQEALGVSSKNPLDRTPPQKPAGDGERPSDISPELWGLLKAGKLRKTLGHPADGGFRSPKGVGGLHFGSKKT